MPRSRQGSSGSTATRWPTSTPRASGPSSVTSARISWPSTAGKLLKGSSCGLALKKRVAMSEPHSPVSSGLSRTQSGPGRVGRGQLAQGEAAPAPVVHLRVQAPQPLGHDVLGDGEVEDESLHGDGRSLAARPAGRPSLAPPDVRRHARPSCIGCRRWSMARKSDDTSRKRSQPEEVRLEASLRPRTFDEYVGQSAVVEKLKVYVQAAKQPRRRAGPLPLLRPPGPGQDVAGAHHRRRAGRGHPRHQRPRPRAQGRPRRPAHQPQRRATSSSSTRSTGSTPPSRSTSTRRWRTSGWTSPSTPGPPRGR